MILDLLLFLNKKERKEKKKGEWDEKCVMRVKEWIFVFFCSKCEWRKERRGLFGTHERIRRTKCGSQTILLHPHCARTCCSLLLAPSISNSILTKNIFFWMVFFFFNLTLIFILKFSLTSIFEYSLRISYLESIF